MTGTVYIAGFGETNVAWLHYQNPECAAYSVNGTVSFMQQCSESIVFPLMF